MVTYSLSLWKVYSLVPYKSQMSDTPQLIGGFLLKPLRNRILWSLGLSSKDLTNVRQASQIGQLLKPTPVAVQVLTTVELTSLLALDCCQLQSDKQ